MERKEQTHGREQSFLFGIINIDFLATMKRLKKISAQGDDHFIPPNLAAQSKFIKREYIYHIRSHP